jgi:hypothetical protein
VSPRRAPKKKPKNFHLTTMSEEEEARNRRTATKVTVLVDTSGSTNAIQSCIRRELKTYLAREQSYGDGDNRFITLCTFASDVQEVFSEVRPSKIDIEGAMAKIDSCGTTSLYDAIGQAIAAHVAFEAARSSGESWVDHTIIVITDGHDTSSTIFTQETIQKLVSQKKDDSQYIFAFVFVGKNSWSNASIFGDDTAILVDAPYSSGGGTLRNLSIRVTTTTTNDELPPANDAFSSQLSEVLDATFSRQFSYEERADRMRELSFMSTQCSEEGDE